MAPQSHDVSKVFVELGFGIVGLALLARFANRLGFSAIPLYLLFGLAFGNGGLVPLSVSAEFTHIGAEIGVLLLLFMLGLEYTGEDLKESLQTGLPSGLVDFALNFPPGLIAGLLLRWGPLPSALLGGVTYTSSSGIIARVTCRVNPAEQPRNTIDYSGNRLEAIVVVRPNGPDQVGRESAKRRCTWSSPFGD